MNTINRLFYITFALKLLGAQTAIANDLTAARVELGKQLFFDKRLSIDNTISCASCHDLPSGGDDNRAVSIGVGDQLGIRSSPTVWDVALNQVLLWDGRTDSLEMQAQEALTNPLEMGMSLDSLIAKVGEIPGYVEAFQIAFPDSLNSLDTDNLLNAIAEFERTLLTTNNKVDRFVGGDSSALNSLEQRGMALVRTSCRRSRNRRCGHVQFVARVSVDGCLAC